MERVLKNQEPEELVSYRGLAPEAKWESFRGDPAYTVCRDRLVRDQRGLCAYCEITINPNDPLQSRVEHFHPKSDEVAGHNWALAVALRRLDTKPLENRRISLFF